MRYRRAKCRTEEHSAVQFNTYGCLPRLLFQNFQFEFQEAPQILFDKVIEIKVSSTIYIYIYIIICVSAAYTKVTDLGLARMYTCGVTSSQVVHRRTLAFLMTHIGTFKIDISTVYNQPGTSTAQITVL